MGLVSSQISGSIDQDGEHGSEIGLTGSIIIANVSDSGDFPRIPTDVGIDSVFYVSGSTTGEGQDEGKDYTGTSVFGGDLVISGVLYGGFDNEANGTFLEFNADQIVVSSQEGSHNAEPASDTLFFVSGAIESKDSGTKGTSVFGGDLVVSGVLYGGYDSEAETTLLEANADLIILSSKAGTENVEPGGDTAFFVSGTIDSRNSVTRGTSVFGGDVVISGSLWAKQKHIHTHKYDSAGTGQAYIRFNQTGQNASPGVNNKFVVPYDGVLIKVIARSTNAAGSTAIALHKNTDGNANLDTSATATVTVDMASANTSYEFEFDHDASFSEGNIVGLSLNPTNNPNDVDLVSVWEFETY